MKKILNFWLMAAMIFGLGMSVTSCKDDDNNGDGKTEEQKQEEAQMKASKFYEVVSRLADLSEMNDATYESQTFEPIIGEESENDPLTRIVATNDMETAALRFADIVGLTAGNGFAASTPSYTYDDPDVGTLTYTKSTDGKSWATVEVNIKQVPHLTKIVYCTPEQMGENASKDWTAYYRFGDVIKRRYVSSNMTVATEYWICVRPAFSLEGKGDSHWISVGQLPEDYMQRYPTTEGEMWDGDKVWYVPTKVCTDKENMQNFAEMLYAIFNPVQWEYNVTHLAGDGLKMFRDFKPANINYHNQYFWKRVYNGWRENRIAEEAFNINFDDLEAFVGQGEVNLLWKGYSWFYNLSEWMGGWNCDLYTARFSNGADPSEKNFHLAEYETVKKSMKDIKFDCHKMGKNRENYREFFGGGDDRTYRWVVRYAKGSQLMASGTFNKFENIVGCEDVWRYNEKYGPWNNLSNTKPEVTPVGFTDRGYYTLGDVVKDQKGNRWICAQASPNNNKDYPGSNYAYFVSFEQGAMGANLENLPKKNVAMQMLYNMSVLFHDVMSSGTGGFAGASVNNMMEYGKLNIKEIFAARDSLHAYPNNPGNHMQVPNDFISTLYRDTDGKVCVLRLIADYTAAMEDGTRWWSWKFYDSYTHNLTTAPRRMLLSDLGDASIISTYNRDRWVTLPWHEYATNSRTPSPGYRTQTENVSDLARFAYVSGRSYRDGTGPTNMYREPLVAFAVKRVADDGSEGTLAFDDGTKFTHECIGHKVNPDYLGKDWPAYTYIKRYFDTMTMHFLNNVEYQWGMSNPTE